MQMLSAPTIAVVDDHDLVRKSLCDMLTIIGFNVVMKAVDGKDFLLQMRKTDVVPDLCILDINMPEMNGVQAAYCAKTLWPGMKILAHTFDSSDTEAMKKTGIDGFLFKGCGMLELKRVLTEIHSCGANS